MGYFSAAAYDDNGQFIAAITGVTLEPFSDMSLENIENSGCAIAPGTYDVVSGTYDNNSGYYQVSGVDGRTSIFFHIGNSSIDTDGNIKSSTIDKSYDETADKEALRVVSLMPRWKAAIDKGKNVPCLFTIPFRYK